MTQLKLAYKVARTQKGQKEIPGDKDNPKIVEYHQATLLQASDDETPWCSSFVNWCYIIAGILLNPGKMEFLLIMGKYEERDVNLFFKSAIDVAQMIGYPVDPIVRRITQNQGEFNGTVKLPTRSAMARSWIAFGKKTNRPSEGDLAVFSRGNNGLSGHVGFVVCPGIFAIDLLGGNQNNQVCETKYNAQRLLGYFTEK